MKNAEIDKLLHKLKNNSFEDNIFTGVAFASFNTIKDVNNFIDLYPKTFIGYIYVYLRQFYYTINVFADSQKKLDHKKTSTYRVVKGMAPSEVKWNNLEYSNINRFCRIIIVYLLTLILIGVGFVIIYYLNVGQAKASTLYGADSKVTTGISVAISLVISLINFLTSILLRSLTS